MGINQRGSSQHFVQYGVFFGEEKNFCLGDLDRSVICETQPEERLAPTSMQSGLLLRGLREEQ